MSSQERFQAGSRITLKIHDLAFGGEGVGRFGEFVVFVPFTAPGDEAEIELTEVKKRFARGKVLQLIHPAASRVEPLCPYFGDCGGCQYQHIAYPVQLEFKQKQIQDLFDRVGGFNGSVSVAPVTPCPMEYHYRNRIMIRSQWDKFKQGLNIGFIKADNRLVCDIEECKISDPLLNEQIQQVRKNPPPKGGIKIVLRVTDPAWEIPRDSFFQNNFHLLPALVEGVRSCVRSSQVRYLVDVYCGVGFFALELASLVERFVGVELDALAIRAARKNQENRGITNGEFLDGRAELLLPELLQRFPARETVVVLDPPRTGCPPESIEQLRQVRPAQIIYISCHPATLARDLALLCADAVYQLQQVQPFDMFPQTQHVECVADLRLIRKD
ncbi:MAG: class I SAM-dependent RNA methyltransferase [Verrucomicrobiota bacterium]|nr:class I SAM-dependent RNA methyltransferase [Verrucomicrobiota bacterium]